MRHELVGLTLAAAGLAACHGSDSMQIPLHDIQVQESAAHAAPGDLRVFRTMGPSTLHVGASWELLAEAGGGQGPIHFKWTATSGMLSASEGDLVTWTATEPVGRAEIVIEAVDGAGNSTSGAMGVAVPFSLAAGVVEDVRDSVGYYCSLALDGSDRPLIAYYDSTHPALRFARYNGTSWEVELVEGFGLDIGGAAGQNASLAVDANGVPHVAYLTKYSSQTTPSVNYATKVGTAWQIVTIDQGSTSGYFNVAIQVNPTTNKPEIVYLTADNVTLKHAVCTGTCTAPAAAGWSLGTVITYTAVHNPYAFLGDFVISPTGVRHVAFAGHSYDLSYSYTGVLLYAQSSGPGWSPPETIIPSRYVSSITQDTDASRITLDHDGNPLVLHTNGFYHRAAAGGWSLSVVDPNAQDVVSSDVACDAGRTPPASGVVWLTIVHGSSYSYGDLELIKTNARGYFEYTYVGSSDRTVGARTSVAIDSAGAAHLCWVDGGALKYQ